MLQNGTHWGQIVPRRLSFVNTKCVSLYGGHMVFTKVMRRGTIWPQCVPFCNIFYVLAMKILGVLWMCPRCVPGMFVLLWFLKKLGRVPGVFWACCFCFILKKNLGRVPGVFSVFSVFQSLSNSKKREKKRCIHMIALVIEFAKTIIKLETNLV